VLAAVQRVEWNGAGPRGQRPEGRHKDPRLRARFWFCVYLNIKDKALDSGQQYPTE